MYFISINGKALPVPSYYRVDNDDIDSTDSKRSDETGTMHRRRLRKGVRTCEVKWILDGSAASGLHTDLHRIFQTWQQKQTHRQVER